MVCLGPGDGIECVDGCVRSKPDCDECAQKFEGEPIKALRWGFRGIVEDMAASDVGVNIDNADSWLRRGSISRNVIQGHGDGDREHAW
jgi:hypothetical protein